MNIAHLHRGLCRVRRGRGLSAAIDIVHRVLCFVLFNSYVPLTVEIGEGTRFAYGGIGVVIHERCRIGRSCVVGQGVTMGGRSGHDGVPTVGDCVYIGPGVRILGPVTIGSNSTVGANAVVVDDVPPGSIVVGPKARPLRPRNES